MPEQDVVGTATYRWDGDELLLDEDDALSDSMFERVADATPLFLPTWVQKAIRHDVLSPHNIGTVYVYSGSEAKATTSVVWRKSS